jgi:hypothetical protein
VKPVRLQIPFCTHLQKAGRRWVELAVTQTPVKWGMI